MGALRLTAQATDFSTVTETPGNQITREAWSMMWTRYAFAAQYCEGKDVLEVACGAGQGLGHLARTARRVVGGDYTGHLARIAHEHYRDRVPVMQLDAQALPFVDRSFDVVILYEAIYYLPEPGEFLEECRRILRDGGVVLTCTANREWEGFNPSPYSVRYLSADELLRLFRTHGFDAEVYAAYPVQEATVRDRILSSIRRVAVGLHLIPKTMAGKAFLKRIFCGKLVTLPPEFSDDMPRASRPETLDDTRSARGYKVLYAAGRPAS